ncbi:shikimate kinase [Phocea massiliensis]|jgi:shikimate kinase|uniref:Shikimate kinase n=1 Tax=uncultured Anaerotruncus sp. TaxID=905011 RepID=A0A6N2UDZ0_9FIRM|nr:shikimate kinase [Merdimmobilis hominis]MCD4835409.1 shikimate kinase [Merdimmobilis hominis]
MQERAIVLSGFMGCGKTTVGKALAEALSRPFCDLDDEIARRAGMPIPRIFDALGEDIFRQLEREALGSLPSLEGFVVASGGGAFTFPDNWEAAKEHALVVFLDADFPTCYHRVKDSDRPIVRRSTPLQLEELFRSRYPLYQAHCHRTVDASPLPPQVVSSIRALL